MTQLLLDEWRTPIYYRLDGTREEFPNYEINRRGEIRVRKSLRYITISTSGGTSKMSLYGWKWKT